MHSLAESAQSLVQRLPSERPVPDLEKPGFLVPKCGERLTVLQYCVSRKECFGCCRTRIGTQWVDPILSPPPRTKKNAAGEGELVGDKTPCTGGARFPFFRSCVLWSTKTHPWCIRRESMSFPAARLETRIQEFVTCGSAVPVPVIGTAVIQCAKTQRAACRSVGSPIPFPSCT